MTKQKAPTHLTPETAEWWQDVNENYDLDGHHVRLLTLACEAFDRCRQAREILERDGLVSETAGGGFKTHPAVTIERDSRLAFARLVRELDLDVEAPADPRPPALRSNRRPEPCQ